MWTYKRVATMLTTVAAVMLAQSNRADTSARDIGLAWQMPHLKQAVYQDTLVSPPSGAPASVSPASVSPEQVSSPNAADILPESTRPIGLVTVNTDLPGGELPDNVAARVLASEYHSLLPVAHIWPVQYYHWTAAATRHQPLYFEEVNAERYGYTCSRALQPAISAAHFFGTIPALPYLKGADCPWECNYTLGHYRPGSCNPWRRHWWPVSLRGAACEAGIVTGVVFVIP